MNNNKPSIVRHINEVTGGCDLLPAGASFNRNPYDISLNGVLNDDEFVMYSAAGSHPRLSRNGQYTAWKPSKHTSNDIEGAAFATFLACVFPGAALISALEHVHSAQHMLNGDKGLGINIRHTENINPRDALKPQLAHMASTPLSQQNININPMQELWQRKRAERQVKDNNEKRALQTKKRGI